ncbi:MAG TPA: hypothetical protein ENN43_03485 [bacterium]|nr:hypothetical protein [bacterium]
MNKESLTPVENVKQRGQILATVIIVGAVLAVLAYALLFVFESDIRLMVRTMDIIRKQELANVGLEHARYFIQTGNNWGRIPVAGYQYDKEYEVAGLGTYTLYIMRGNLFIDDSGDRQGATEYRTIGIKVKLRPSGNTHMYYGVVQRAGYGGPLISKGKIDLPCTDAAINNEKYNFYWGDIYSANPNDGMCYIPSIPVARGASNPPAWMPAVYAAGNIYTALGRSGTSHIFGYTYDDMSPTARAHPYSSFAKAPDLSLNAYKMQAAEQDNYWGPATIDGNANPYYRGKDLADLTARTISAAMTDMSKVFFIDTVDGKPLAYDSGTGLWNTYTGYIHATMSANTIGIYENADCQLYTVGSLIVMGPLVLKGHNPGPEPPKGKGQVDPLTDYWPTKVFVERPTNYYFPQASSDHFDYRSGDAHGTRLVDIKVAGFLYTAGELRIGGTRCTSGSCDNILGQKDSMFASMEPKQNIFSFIPSLFGITNLYGGSSKPPSDPLCLSDGKTYSSDICIYGTVYIGEYGSLTVNTTTDDPKFYFYFNNKANAFAFLQPSIIVTSFKEITFLVPTPAPDYPASF